MYKTHYSFTLTIPHFLTVDLSSGCLACLNLSFKKRQYGKLTHDEQKAFVDYLLHTSIFEYLALEYYFEVTPSSPVNHLHVHGIASFDDVQNFDKWRATVFKTLKIKAEKQQAQMMMYSEVNSHFWEQYMKKEQAKGIAGLGSLVIKREADDYYSTYRFGRN